jgi:hypothetical protein
VSVAPPVLIHPAGGVAVSGTVTNKLPSSSGSSSSSTLGGGAKK